MGETNATHIEMYGARRTQSLESGLRVPDPEQAWRQTSILLGRANFTGLVIGGGGGRPAVAKPNFARKYALESSRRDLHNTLFCTALKSDFFKKKC